MDRRVFPVVPGEAVLLTVASLASALTCPLTVPASTFSSSCAVTKPASCAVSLTDSAGGAKIALLVFGSHLVNAFRPLRPECISVFLRCIVHRSTQFRQFFG